MTFEKQKHKAKTPSSCETYCSEVINEVAQGLPPEYIPALCQATISGGIVPCRYNASVCSANTGLSGMDEAQCEKLVEARK
jgi:hypothetical protein